MNSKENLCDTCAQSFPTCDGNNLFFGNGKGNDNIIACDSYTEECCTWENSEGVNSDDSDTHWSTSCGNEFILNDGTPENNEIDFCCYCGKPIDQLVISDE